MAATAAFVTTLCLAFAPAVYVELFLDLGSPNRISDSVIILLYFTPMAFEMCFVFPLAIFCVANDFKLFLKSLLCCSFDQVVVVQQ